MFLFSLLMVIAVYDIRHKIIPDKLVYLFSLLALGSVFINTSGIGSIFVWPVSKWALLSGPLLALPFVLLWLVSKGRWMGLGDAKLVLGLGWLLGLVFGLTAIFFAFWLGTVASLFLIILSRRKITGKTEIPLAPFLIVGALIIFFLQMDFLSLSLLFRF